MPFLSYKDFSVTKIKRFADGSFGVTLGTDKDPGNYLCHTGKAPYLRRVLRDRYGITNVVFR